MKITIEAPFEVSSKDRKFMEEKIQELTKFESRMTQVNAYFKKDDGKLPNGILSEIVVRVPGKDIFAESVDQNALKAFSKTLSAVKRQVKVRRDKLNNHKSEVKQINEIVNNTY